MILMPPTFEEFEIEIKKLSGLEENAKYRVDGNYIHLKKHYSIVVGYPGVIYVEPEESNMGHWHIRLIVLLCIAGVLYALDCVLPAFDPF